MISAKEAKQIATELISEKSKLQLKDIEKCITEAANKGQFYCNIWWDNLMPNVIYYLEQQGYVIKNQTGCSETYTTISWSDAQC